jgi:hypothetical protein
MSGYGVDDYTGQGEEIEEEIRFDEMSLTKNVSCYEIKGHYKPQTRCEKFQTYYWVFAGNTSKSHPA